jgi:uncharacterized membrane protein
MSEEYLSSNPESLFHYQRLRRDRAMMRRRGYVLLIAAGLLLVGVMLVGSAGLSGRSLRIVPLALFLGFAVLLLWSGLAALYRARQPISDGEVARQRQEERQQLFQFAQGHISWRYWLTVAVQSVIGLIFLAFGLQGVWSLAAHPNTVDLEGMVLSFGFVLVGWFSLSRALGRVRMLRRLTKISSQELAARLSLGEATEGE